MDALAPVRAAGGVVWRQGAHGDREVVLVHRPRHDDWTLPKGKLEPGEAPILAAVREVWEETAIRPVLGARLPTVRYDVWAKGMEHPALVDKLVDYWAMRVAEDDGFVPGRETDVRVWLGLDEARHRLTYPHDVKVLTAFSELPTLRDPVVVLRHGSAGRRSEFHGPDAARPLDAGGLARAAELVAPLRAFAPSNLFASTMRRCAQTLEPLARVLDLTVRPDPSFDDDAEPSAAARRLQALSDIGGPVVVCGQGRLIPAALSALSGRAASSYRTAKGAGWVLSFSDKGLAVIDALAA